MSRTAVEAARRTEVMVHHSDGPEPAPAAIAATLRAIQAEHMGRRGWADIGYNLVVGPDGSAWEGRGWDVIGAHCYNHNTSAFGLAVLGTFTDHRPTDAALATVEALRAEAEARAGHALAFLGHRDGFATACPGEQLYQWVHCGAGPVPTPHPAPASPSPAPTGQVVAPGIPAPGYPLPDGWYFGPRSGPTESVSGYPRADGQDHRGDLARWQQQMIARGWGLGVSGADGLYGPRTHDVAAQFQHEKGLDVDGLIGPKTWAAAWEAPVTR